MSQEAATLPASLPAKPESWTRRMQLHMNFGREGGAATYSIHMPDGTRTPIAWQYDTRKGGRTGFLLPGADRVMTWAELVAEWPEYLKRTAPDPADSGRNGE